MNNEKIAVIDSGKGGLTVLDELKQLLKNEDFIYYADTINNPYGEKTDEELLNITSHIIEYLKTLNVKLIVIACNTATTRCMKMLKEKYKDTIFVGTVPAIKVAIDNKCKNILVLATDNTTGSERVQEIIDDNMTTQKVMLQSCPSLAKAIEDSDNLKINHLLDTYLNQYKNKNIDGVVLGCTHYPLIKKEIANYFKNAMIFDSSIGVSKEVKRQLKLHNIENNKLHKQQIIYLDSKNM